MIAPGSNPNQLRHLDYQREPNREPPRRKKIANFPREKPPIPSSRAEHGNDIRTSTLSAIEGSTNARATIGIDPYRLLVLELHNVNLEIRDILEERFHAIVIDEESVKDDQTIRCKLLVQFPDKSAIERFQREVDLYIRERTTRQTLTWATRRDMFDSIERISLPSREHRIGPRLRQKGYPQSDSFYFDLDLWHPGSNSEALTLQQEIRRVASSHHGQVTSTVKTADLLLMTIHGSQAVAEALLDLDFVARLDLPVVLDEGYIAVSTSSGASTPRIKPPSDEPMACLIDSGVVSGHPLLTGWIVDEVDFDSGEATPSDHNGHGTSVAGLIVYGDILHQINSGYWRPRVRLCSAKILRHDDVTGNAVLPDGKRFEELLERAIRYFHEEWGCRIFNVSVGSFDEIYAGGRQYPLAELIDQLIRELDIVVVVSSGNRPTVDVPVPQNSHTRNEFHKEVRDGMFDRSQRIANPGTSALAVTVGSIARSGATNDSVNISPPAPLRDAVPGAQDDMPSPFSRVGPGYEIDATKQGIKPDLVQYGGNYALQTVAAGSPRWIFNHLLLGEPTIQIVNGGRYLCTRVGTSFSCPKITHAAAIAQESLSAILDRPPSANSIRALLGSASRITKDERDWLGSEENRLRVLGNGASILDDVEWSTPNRVVLVAEDSIEVDRYHIYRLPLPRAFFDAPGLRGLTVSLAFDPPVRSTRRKYLAHTMSFDVYQGLSTEDVQRFRSHHSGDQPPRAPQTSRLDLRPTMTQSQWSTLQVRRVEWKRTPKLSSSENGDRPDLHLVVTCKQEYPTGLVQRQKYGLVVVLWHDLATVRLYEELRSRARIRTERVRTRV